ncbi:hypothetical protein C2E23DRAFT_209535 [Lenzites betulinus]|nr:hypothetical protein C2E23DRAFT_209535 [Lenzites betulinus]
MTSARMARRGAWRQPCHPVRHATVAMRCRLREEARNARDDRSTERSRAHKRRSCPLRTHIGPTRETIAPSGKRSPRGAGQLHPALDAARAPLGLAIIPGSPPTQPALLEAHVDPACCCRVRLVWAAPERAPPRLLSRIARARTRWGTRGPLSAGLGKRLELRSCLRLALGCPI